MAQNPLNEDFEKVVLATLEEWHIPGMSIAVVDNDNVYSKARTCLFLLLCLLLSLLLLP